MEKSMPRSAAAPLEEMHPTLPISTRFCIVGGGPSGLSAAYALVKLGYENVTVLEKYHTVAGMCESLEIEGFTYDLGGQVVTKDSSPTIMGLAHEMGLEMEDMSEHKLALIDCSDKSYEDLNMAQDYLSVIPLTFKLQALAEQSSKMGVHAVSSLASEPSDVYVENAGLSSGVPLSISTGYTASGYGFVQDMAYAYLHEYIRTSMFGKLRRLKTGYTSLWRKIGESLPCVRCNSEVVKIYRDDNGVINVSFKVKQQSGSQREEEQKFDKLIISGSWPYVGRNRSYRSSSMLPASGLKCKGLMNFSVEEEELFSKVKTIEYYTTVLKVSGLELPKGFYNCKRYTEDPSTIGHPVAIQRFHVETNVYLCWSYGNSEVDGTKVTEFLYEDIKSMGGKVEEFILQRKWDYFPHISCADMKDGFYDTIEEMQGKNNTLYVGGLLAFELTERNAAYAMNLVAKHFASPTQTIQYVKKLFPLSDDKLYSIKEQAELPGVEFPELASLDAYLRFWANHPVVGHRVLYTWLNEEGTETDKLTFAELDRQATVTAQRLLNTKPSLMPGDRVLLIYPPGLEFIASFFGCIRARVVPVPLVPPDPMQRPGQALAKVAKVAEVTESKAILSTAPFHSAVSMGSLRNSFSRNRTSSPRWPNLPWHHTDTWIGPRRQETKGLLGRVLSRTNMSVSPRGRTPGNSPGKDWAMPLLLSPGHPSSAPNSPPLSPSSLLNGSGNSPNHLEDFQIETTSPEPTDICFLQFTSGSTGDPKGVMITHGGLIHNLKLMHRIYRSTSQTVLVSWLPQYHDMGLVGGLFTAMVSGGTAILFSPITFIRKPLLWLDTMSKYGATHSAGPNFAFELVVRKYRMEESAGRVPTYDFSSLRFLMTSAEPIRPKTVKKFLEMLRKSGLTEQVMAPGYGLAENCVFVSCAWGRQKPIMVDWQGRVCCGYVEKGDKDADIRIANPDTGEEEEDGKEGEVWVSSPSSGAGYWAKAGDDTFKNILKAKELQGAGSEIKYYLRTGDLGRLIAGKLFITGRLKEVIIVQGRNLYPADIEKTVEENCDCIRPGCCAVIGASQSTLESIGINVSSDSSQDVGIVVVAEVRDPYTNLDSDIFDRIKDSVAEEHGVEIAFISLIKPRTISKTSSGKIRRLECLKQFSQGNLHVITHSGNTPTSSPRSSSPTTPLPRVSSLYSSITRSRDEIDKFLIALISDKTGISPSRISVSQSFSVYGLTSASIVWAAQKLSDFLGVHVAAIDIYTASSISELSTVALALAAKASTAPADASSAQQHRKLPGRLDIQEFLVHLVVERTGISPEKISLSQPLTSYGINSVAVVLAAQKLSTFLGITVAAIDIYTCSCISDLIDLSESLIKKAHPEHQSAATAQPNTLPKPDTAQQLEEEILRETDTEISVAPSVPRRIFITVLQWLGILFAAAIVVLPAAPVCWIVSKVAERGTMTSLMLAVGLIPAAVLAYIAIVGASIAVCAVPLLQPNYARDPCVPLWTAAFVKWWTLYRLQDFATHKVAYSLRGSVFMTWWYRAMGARIGSGAVLDTLDITDPGAVHIGTAAILSEGATLQAHHVSNGLLRLRPMLVGSRAWVGPYSLATTSLSPGSQLGALHVAGADTMLRVNESDKAMQGKEPSLLHALLQLGGLYVVFLVPVISAIIAYLAFTFFSHKIYPLPHDSMFRIPSLQDSKLSFPLATALPWHVAGLTPLFAFRDNLHLLFNNLVQLAIQGKALASITCLVGTYMTYGLTLCAITSALKWCLIGKLKPVEEITLNSNLGFRLWLVHRLIDSTHVKFSMFLSGTEAFCMYLRSMGAKVGLMASIRGVNALTDPDLLEVHEHSHLGDFANIITTMLTSKRTLCAQKVNIGAKSVVGAHSVILPGSTLEKQVMLGAMSLVAGRGCVLREGGIFVGVENLVMVNQQSSTAATLNAIDQDITHQMEPSYKRMIAQLAGHIATTTLKVNARYFHRIGVAGRGTMRVLDKLPVGMPDHNIFSPGRCFSVIVRHSNSLSSDDDARGDARGAALRILQTEDKNDVEDVLIDLTLKSGKTFYAATLTDFLSWLMGSREQRIEIAKRAPHSAEAAWLSLRKPNSYTELHYYSCTCCLLRSTDVRSTDHYVRFCLRPGDPQFVEDEGKVEAQDVIPPDTGMLPRDPTDTRPLLFLADDFCTKVLSPTAVKYVLQLQLRPVSPSMEINKIALDCSKPWDERLYPFQDVATIDLNEVLDSTVTESLRFDPMNKTHSLDMIHAKSLSETASVEHGRCLAYAIAQHLRNGLPLRKEWRSMLSEVDIGRELLKQCPKDPSPPRLAINGGCPALAGAAIYSGNMKDLHDDETKFLGLANPTPTSMNHKLDTKGSLQQSAPMKENGQVIHAEEKEGLQFMKLAIIRGVQPLLQASIPMVSFMMVMYPSMLLLSLVGAKWGKGWMLASMPVAYVFSGLLQSLLSILCKWVLIGRTRQTDSSELWGSRSLCDTIWQAIHSLLSTSFLELTRGSLFCIMYFNCLGAKISMRGVYMDTLYALNPDLLEVGAGSSIGRNSLLFGHLYEGGRVVFNKIVMEERSSIGTRALILPGLKMEAGAQLQSLGLGMKDEVISCY